MYFPQNLIWQSLLLCAGVQYAFGLPTAHAQRSSVRNTGVQKVLGNVQEVVKSTIDSNAAQSISKALKEAKIVPDVLPAFEPKVDLKLHFLFDKADVILKNIRLHRPVPVNFGKVLPLPASVPAPTCNGDKSFTLVLLDSDANSRASSNEAQRWNWIVTGLKLQARPTRPTECMLDSSGARDPFWEASKDLRDYTQPTSPSKTGKHQYTFVLLEEKAGTQDKPLREPASRSRGDSKSINQEFADWTKENDLVPIGANFFYA